MRIIRNKFSSVEELLIPDGRHHLVNEAKDLQAAVFNAIVDTFDQNSDGPFSEAC
jgi:alpha-beta hydrolase superfamily lysophospholipase